jgi:hypothetical protein
MKKTTINQEDWEILKRFLPQDWESKARELGALARKKKIKTADTLLRVLLIHLADGKSLRSTAAYAQESRLCEISDVGLLHRLRASSEWLRWMALELLKTIQKAPLLPEEMKRYRIRIVDGTSISEPGSTGTDWRIHYCIQLNALKCDTFVITTPKIGEAFLRYSVKEDDILLGDRGYCKRKGIMHVINNRGKVLVRFHSRALPLYNRNGKACPILEYLRTLKDCEIGDWDVWFKDPEGENLVKGRICALRRSKEAIERAKRLAQKEATRRGNKIKDETLEYAEYVTVFTTVNRHEFKAGDILSLYRGRWQIELIFKRLKGIIGLGHLPKHEDDSCIAWLYGKMIVALLVERLYQEAESFSPWGYPL